MRFVGANRFTWVKEATLAVELHRSMSTIKRWMQQLVVARLIRRDRRFGATSLTYIVAYDVDDAHGDHLEEEPGHANAAGSTSLVSQADHCEEPADISTPVDGGEEGVQVSPALELFFGRTSEPSISSFLVQDSVKNQNPKIGGDGTSTRDIRSEIDGQTPAISQLQAEGVVDTGVLRELRHHQANEVERVVRYVTRCRTQDDPRRPGLIVHLLRRGFGSRRRDRAAGAGNAIRDVSDEKRRSRRPAGGKSLADRPLEHLPSFTPDPALQQTWQQVLAPLATELVEAAYQTWLVSSRLLLLDGGHAVVATPNVFVRDTVIQEYRVPIELQLQAVIGQPIMVEVVIDSVD